MTLFYTIQGDPEIKIVYNVTTIDYCKLNDGKLYYFCKNDNNRELHEISNVTWLNVSKWVQ